VASSIAEARASIGGGAGGVGAYYGFYVYGSGGGGGAGLGGAIFLNQGTLSIQNCTFTNNTATGGVGGQGTQANGVNGSG
jgi:large repetitive protein